MMILTKGPRKYVFGRIARATDVEAMKINQLISRITNAAYYQKNHTTSQQKSNYNNNGNNDHNSLSTIL